MQIDKTKDKRDDRGSGSFTTLCISVGRKQGYTVPQIIGMMNRRLPGKKINFGKIDLQNNITYIGVDSKAARKVVAAFDGATDKGADLNVRIFEGGTNVEGSGKSFNGKKEALQARKLQATGQVRWQEEAP